MVCNSRINGKRCSLTTVRGSPILSPFPKGLEAFVVTVHRQFLFAALLLVAFTVLACTGGPPPDEAPDAAPGEAPGKGENGESGDQPEGYQPPPPSDLSQLQFSGGDFEFVNDVFYFFGADRPPSRALKEIREVHDLKDWSYKPNYPDAAQRTREAISDLRESDYTSWDDAAMVVAIISTMVSRDRSALVRDDCISTLGWFRAWVHPSLIGVGPAVESSEEEVLQALKVLDLLHADPVTPLSTSDRLVCLDAVAVLGNHSWDEVKSDDPIVYRTKMSRPRAIIRRLTGRDLEKSRQDPEIRDTLDRALIRVTDQTLFLSLVAGLTDPVPHVRAGAAREIRKASDPRSLAPLLHTLESEEDAPVRLALISTIAEVAVLTDEGKAASVPGLAAALTDASSAVQRAAARALPRVTGANPGPDPIDWRRWWRAKNPEPVGR